ncbi:MAG: 1-aminocyclopropane-1-carboxylate deaminase/D-cysteine desulfhydrase [Daejeonella sp.]
MVEPSILSPVEEIRDPLFVKKGIRVFVKRDDMIHPFISGNKWRKLKYILPEAQRLNKNHLVTFGGAYSNHLLATACAAAKFGFKSTGVVRGEEVHNDVLMLCRVFGMKLQYSDRETYRNKHSFFGSFFKGDPEAFFIDEGGAGDLAVKGCAELPGELSESYDHIFCAAGTGTTVAGIIQGLQNQYPDTTPHVVPVLKGGDFLKGNIERYTSRPFQNHTDYHFGGYAKSTPELLLFIQTFCASTGILIEPVYTGKMFFAIYDLISKDTFSAGSKILAVHTGGLSGILGMSKTFKF